MSFDQIAKQIYGSIETAQRFLLIPHQNPDGDALGSVGAFRQFLLNKNKTVTTFCATPVSPKLHFVPHTNVITNDPSVWQQQYDRIIVFDSGDLRYAGVATFIDALPKKPEIICFDHHATNEGYGNKNLVVTTAASTTDILYRFFRVNHVTIDKTMATCLLTGLMTDTDSFTNGATSATALSIGSELIKLGGDVHLIKDAVWKDKSVNTLKLWGKILSRLAHHPIHDVVYTYLTAQDMEEHGVGDAETEGIANFLNVLRDGRAALILKELPGGKVKGSFRTTRDDTDVAKIAKQLGGGGHKKAAGFTLEHTIESALEKIWETIAIHGLELVPVIDT